MENQNQNQGTGGSPVPNSAPAPAPNPAPQNVGTDEFAPKPQIITDVNNAANILGKAVNQPAPQAAPAQAQPTQSPAPQAAPTQPVIPQPAQPVAPVQPNPTPARPVNQQVPLSPAGVPIMPNRPPNNVARKKKGPQLGMGCLAMAVVLLVLAAASMILIFSSGGSNNIFGMSGDQLKSMMMAVTMGFFGFIAMAMLIYLTVLIFKRVALPATDVAGRKKSLKNILITTGLFIFSVLTLILVYWFVSNLETSAKSKDYIVTDIVEPSRCSSIGETYASGCTGPLEVNLSENVSGITGKKVVSCEWSFDQGKKYEFGSCKVFNHTFDEIGSYPVMLSVKFADNSEQVIETVENIAVTRMEDINNEITAKIVTSPTDLTNLTAPFKVSVDGSQSGSKAGNITKYTWDFGDGSPSRSAKRQTYTYTKAGSYIITLLIEDEKGNKATKTLPIEIKSIPTAPVAIIKSDQKVEVAKDQTNFIKGILPMEVSFTSISTDKDDNIVDYFWDLDADGSTDIEGESISYRYETAGEYLATLKVVDTDGQESTDQILVIVEEDSLRPIISTNPSPATGPAPFTVEFDGSASEYEGGEITAYQWDFDDNTQPGIFDAKLTHVFNLVGEYDVKMTIIAEDGRKGSTTKKVIVRNTPLEAKISPSVLRGEAPLKVIFDGSDSEGSVRDYSWDFGDKQTSNQVRPTHIYTKPGTYTVKLAVIDDRSNTDTHEIDILVEESD